VLTTNGAGAVTFADAGGGSPDLYAENYDGTSTLPSATGTNAVALNVQAEATGSYATALGYDAVASGSFSTATGQGSSAGASRSVALGFQATTATGSNAAAIGKAYASGADSFAAAIANNTSTYGAVNTNAIAIGNQAKANGSNALAFGGTLNLVTNSLAVALGGYDNHATGIAAVSIGGNQGNRATGNASFCVGGYQSSNIASDDNSFAMGEGAKSAVKGKLAYAGGAFAAIGDAQGGQFILRADTTDATATVLTTNNSTAASTNQIVAASDTCITFDGTITAMQNGAQAYASWKIEGLLVNDGGTATLANSATTVISNADGWGMALSADNTNNALAITVTGEASHNIRWVANIRTTEVTYA
jgi:hypothetical protein